jgi:hypothetical protein
MADKDPMVSFVVEEFQRYELSCRDRFDKARKIIDHWMGKPPAREWDWQNAVHVPMTFEAEQTISPRLFAALFPTDDPVDVRVYEDATATQGLSIKFYLQHQFMRSDVQGEAIPALSQCTLLGTSYLEAGWLVERKWQIDPRTGERYQAITNNRNDCKFVNFFELYPHPAKLSVGDGLPLIRRQFCDAEYLKRLAENPRFKFENLKEALESEPVVDIPTSIIGADGNKLNLKDRERYELLSYWGPWDTSYEKDGKVVTKKAVPYWIIVVNRSVKVRGVPNPFNHQQPPFCRLTLFDDVIPSWFGIGVGQIGYPTQERLNKIVNQRLDNVDLVMNKQGFYNGNDILINHKKLCISKPGQWHKVSDTVTSIRWMETPDVTQSSYKEEELAKSDYRESTGASMPLMPTDEGQHRTAMGINLLQNAAGARFKPVLKKLERDFIHELAMMYLSNAQQFMALPEWITIVTDRGQEQPILIKPENIQAKAEIIPMGVSETIAREVMVGQLLRFKELTIQDQTVNRQEINKRIAEQMGFKDVQKLLTPPAPIMMKPGGLAAQDQQYIQQRIAEGASMDQIKAELMGPPPANPPMSEPNYG